MYFSPRNLDFLLYDVFDVAALTRFPHFADHSRETFELVTRTAAQIGDTHLRPLLLEMDRQEPHLTDGQIRVHPRVRALMKLYGEGGWIAAGAPYALGGQQLPLTLTSAAAFIFGAANYSASVYPFLSAGAGNLILSFGSSALQQTYLPKLYAGEWQGTMALTEPGAGSSLSDLVTTAHPTNGDAYLIQGQKIFISAGDHDGVDNIIHLMLARIAGAPAGTKGISLFVVPKKRLQDGQLTPNDLQTIGVYHKLGYKGAPIAHLLMGEHGDCHGYLVGEPHQGLSYMFQMMNEARVGVGMGAVALASAAYCASLAYARERPQGRRLTRKDPTQPPVPIVEHPDVKRMLLFQKAVVEGSLALLLQCGLYADVAKGAEGEEREKAELLLDFLTPIAKSYPSEMGLLSISAGLQCLGGYGYTEDFPLELFYRDARIHPIHEGTTGIHGQDLLGRKVTMHGGRAYWLFTQEIHHTTQLAEQQDELARFAQQLNTAVAQLQTVTKHLLTVATRGDAEVFLADATLYLELAGIVTVAWQWLKQAIPAQQALATLPSADPERAFYRGKLHALAYFFGYELPKTAGLATRLLADDPLTVTMNPADF